MEGKTQEPMTMSGPLTPVASSYITKRKEPTPRYAWVVWIVTFLVSFAAPPGQGLRVPESPRRGARRVTHGKGSRHGR